MSISMTEIFKIGIGPSSSHTVGPMLAASLFCEKIISENLKDKVHSIEVDLFGSLALTGKGHGTDKAICLGLMGDTPENVDLDQIDYKLSLAQNGSLIHYRDEFQFEFQFSSHLHFLRKQSLPQHPNGMRFRAKAKNGEEILIKNYYSVGGGFVVDEQQGKEGDFIGAPVKVPYPFKSGQDILDLCKEEGLSISSLMYKNEDAYRPRIETEKYLDSIWQCMSDCIDRGCKNEGILPGGLKVKRRAANLLRRLKNSHSSKDPFIIMDWVDLWALAVNEENAGGGRVVTAPTNGAAGVLPAVIKYYTKVNPDYNSEDIHRFLLTAAAVGILYKINASISGAEVGCQGEVGVACSMAAAGLTEIMGGSPSQVENAAEIGMEHNLGLTCDPVGGLVQVPCIERNAMGAIKAINASRLALQGDGSHKVSLDKVIKTMRETGADMKSKYKETARGGLAVNIIEC
ncbi:MAG: L-serine ammonia-lyase [Bdellovibrionota bacterium]